MKKLSLFVIVLLIVFSVSAFAADTVSWAESYNRNGQVNFYASIGFYSGLDLSGGLELVLGEFNLGGLPIDYGFMGRVTFNSYTALNLIAIGIAPMFAFHWGFADINFEFYWALGIGFSFGDWYSAYDYNTFGFAYSAGFRWFFAPNMGLLLEWVSIGYTYSYGLGISFKF